MVFPDVAQATVGNWRDLVSKAEKAIAVDGPGFLERLWHLGPPRLAHRFPASPAGVFCRMAVNSKFWPLFEVENGKLEAHSGSR